VAQASKSSTEASTSVSTTESAAIKAGSSSAPVPTITEVHIYY
jgi:hypothetical protein